MKYTISKEEITRRKKAYISFATTLFVGFFIWSLVFKFPIPFFFYILLVIALFLIGWLSFVFFQYFLKTKIELSKKSLIKYVNGKTENYQLSDVKEVKIKWTSKHKIREIGILLNDKSITFISALNTIDQFYKDLLSYINNIVPVKEFKEPLNYDSAFFYPFLAISVSAVSLLIFKFILPLQYQYVNLVFAGFFIYLLILGVYFIYSKPLSKRYGNKTVVSDYLFGAFFVFLGIIFLLIFRFPK